MASRRNAAGRGPTRHTDSPRRPVSDDPLPRPLSPRSVIASLLLGIHPPRLRGALLVRWCGLLGIAEGTTRVALSRMVDAGELTTTAGRYELAGPLRARQAGQDWSLAPVLLPWSGEWDLWLVRPGGGTRPAGPRSGGPRPPPGSSSGATACGDGRATSRRRPPRPRPGSCSPRRPSDGSPVRTRPRRSTSPPRSRFRPRPSDPGVCSATSPRSRRRSRPATWTSWRRRSRSARPRSSRSAGTRCCPPSSSAPSGPGPRSGGLRRVPGGVRDGGPVVVHRGRGRASWPPVELFVTQPPGAAPGG